MIIGSFPIGKFSDPSRRHEIKEHEFEFFFGGERNLLWRLLGDTFGVKLAKKEDIIRLLTREKIGIGDVIHSCVRKDGRASDKDLLEIEWNTGLLDIIRNKKIEKVYFTSKTVERWFYRLFPEATDLRARTLISPSAQSVRALASRQDFRSWRKNNPQAKAYDFILKDYKKAFLAPLD